MVMSGMLFEDVVKRPQAEENHSVQAFGFNRQDKPLGESVQILANAVDRFYVDRSHQTIEMLTELAVPVVDQDSA